MINTDGDGAGLVTHPADPEPPPPVEPTHPASSEVGAATARSAVTGRHHERVDEMPHLERSRQLREHRARNTELNLRRCFGYILLGAVVLHVPVADVVFVTYLVKNDWHIEGTVMQWWLGATVVQVIGLAGVVVKYLFSPDAAPR